MKVLVAPLNWGLGHASRCVPIIRYYMERGDEVVLGGDGASLLLLQRHFPTLRTIPLAPLHLSYSKGKRQVGAMLRAFPQLFRFSIQDHIILRRCLAIERFDYIISDNRFGLFTHTTTSIYITHQLHILLPRPWKWLQPLATFLHACVWKRFHEVWIPDMAQGGLSGILSHEQIQDTSIHISMFAPIVHDKIRYVGVLSRFMTTHKVQVSGIEEYDVVVILSGLEPQRTLLEETLIQRFMQPQEQSKRVLIVQGLVDKPATFFSHDHLTMVSHLNDVDIITVLHKAKHIIARSGYSTIMDFYTLGVLEKTEFIPTPGQPEQEYLATLYNYSKW